MEPVRFIKKDLCWNAVQIRGASPEILFNLVHSVKESLRAQIAGYRVTTDAEAFDKITTDMQMQFGKWSHEFNVVLRLMIREHDLFESTQMIYKTKKYNLVYLYWWKCVQFIELIYSPMMHIPMAKLNSAIRLMEDTYEHFIKMPKEIEIELSETN